MLNIKGEFDIELAGQTRTMKATFGAVERLEAGLMKRTIIETLAEPYKLSATEIASIIHVGLTENSDNRLNRKEVADAAFDVGILSFMKVCVEYLTYLYTGGREAKGQAAGE